MNQLATCSCVYLKLPSVLDQIIFTYQPWTELPVLYRYIIPLPHECQVGSNLSWRAAPLPSRRLYTEGGREIEHPWGGPGFPCWSDSCISSPGYPQKDVPLLKLGSADRLLQKQLIPEMQIPGLRDQDLRCGGLESTWFSSSLGDSGPQ